MIAAITLGGSTIVTALVLLGVLGILWWGLGLMGMPEPIRKAMNIVLIIAVVVILIWFILTITGTRLP